MTLRGADRKHLAGEFGFRINALQQRNHNIVMELGVVALVPEKGA